MTFFRFNLFSNKNNNDLSNASNKRWQRLIWIGLGIVLIGAVVYNVCTYYQAQERLRVVKARTEMVKAQAKNNQLTILSEDKIKEIVALNTGVPLQDLRFTEIGLITFDDVPMPPMSLKKPPFNQNSESDSTNQSNLPEDKNSDASLPPIQMPPDMKNMRKDSSHGLPANSADNSVSHNAPNPSPESGNANENTTPANDRGVPPNMAMNHPPGLPENDFSRTPPGELRKHPLYHIFAKSGGLTYELIIDGVNGHIIKSNVY